MLILTEALGAALALAITLLMTHRDAEDANWYTKVGIKSLAPLAVFDCLLCLAAYTVLSLTAGLVWHGLASKGVVAARHTTPIGTILLCALSAGCGPLPVLGARLPRTQDKLVMRNLRSFREHRLQRLTSRAAQHQTLDHHRRVVPALLKIPGAERVILVKGFAMAMQLQGEDTAFLTDNVERDDPTSLMTFAAHLCRLSGRGHLEDLVAHAAELAEDVPADQ
jgi:hypothetical protein